MNARSIHRSSMWGYAAALWAFVFAVLHAVWAAGWYVLLPQGEARGAFSRPWFRVYNLVVTGACLVAVLLALALARPWGRRVPRLLLGSIAWVGTALLVLRGGGSLLQMAYLVITGRYFYQPMHLYEMWFWLGAVLFSMTLLRLHRRGGPAPN